MTRFTDGYAANKAQSGCASSRMKSKHARLLMKKLAWK
jgi:hypothetical protein